MAQTMGWSLGSLSGQTWFVPFWVLGENPKTQKPKIAHHQKKSEILWEGPLKMKTKKPGKTKKPKNQNCTDHGWSLGSPSRQTWSVQFCFFGFLVFHEKPKNQKTKIAQTMGDLWGAHLDRHGLCNFGFLVFWFSMKKPKNQKNKIAQTMGDLWGAHLDRHGLCNFGFLVFHEKTKKPKKQNCTNHGWSLGSPSRQTWSVQFWFFGFLVFPGFSKKPELTNYRWPLKGSSQQTWPNMVYAIFSSLKWNDYNPNLIHSFPVSHCSSRLALSAVLASLCGNACCALPMCCGEAEAPHRRVTSSIIAFVLAMHMWYGTWFTCSSAHLIPWGQMNRWTMTWRLTAGSILPKEFSNKAKSFSAPSVVFTGACNLSPISGLTIWPLMRATVSILPGIWRY